MIINFLKIVNFRKFEKEVFEFKKGINLIVGNNGAGKTSLVESIWMLVYPRSFRNSKNEQIIKAGKNYSEIKGVGNSEKGRFDITVRILKDKKEIYLFDKKIPSYSYVFSRFPVLLFHSKKDAMLWTKQELWKEFNYIFSLIDKDYYKILLTYRKILKERNKYLKNISSKIDPFKKILQEKGKLLQKKRIIYIDMMEKRVKKFMNIKMKYIPSHLDADFNEEMKRGVTLFGVSRDNILFFKDGLDLRSQCSDGEKRMFLFFLYLSLSNIMKQMSKMSLLLFDDPFSILKYELVRKYIKNCEGQVIMTSLNYIDDNFDNVIELKA